MFRFIFKVTKNAKAIDLGFEFSDPKNIRIPWHGQINILLIFRGVGSWGWVVMGLWGFWV